MPHLPEARRLLHPIEGISDVYSHGHHWVKKTFLPCVRLLASSTRKRDGTLAAVGYYILGDVHDFNGAPRAAIRAYRRSLQLEPTLGAAWREISGMFDSMGKQRSALNALRKAVQIDPADDVARSDLEILEGCPLHTPLYRPGDPCWESSEWLASSRYQRALKVIAGKTSIRASQYRARAYGAMGDNRRVMQEWMRIVKQIGSVRIENPDWFFLPLRVWHDSEFWRILWKIRSRVKDWGFLKGHEDLHDVEPSTRRRHELYVRYHLARTQRNLAAARKSSASHPQWKEAARLVESIG